MLSSRLSFWPSIWLQRFRAGVWPKDRRLADEIPVRKGRLWLGVAPALQGEIDGLIGKLNVDVVVNMCDEWSGHDVEEYRKAGVAEVVRFPTPDMTLPHEQVLHEGADRLNEWLEEEKTVYVHCKAGRGRSFAIVLAYLVKHEGYDLIDAQTMVLNRRPHAYPMAKYKDLREWAEKNRKREMEREE